MEFLKELLFIQQTLILKDNKDNKEKYNKLNNIIIKPISYYPIYCVNIVKK